MNFREKAIKFLHSPKYIAAVAAAVFIFWATGQYVAGTAFFTAVFTFLLAVFKDSSMLSPIVIMVTFMFPLNASQINIGSLMNFAIPAICAGFIVFFVRTKPKIKKGKYFYGFLAAVFAMALGGLGFLYKLEYVTAAAGLSAVTLIVYVFFNSTSGEALKTLVLNSFIAVGLLVLMQLLVYYIRTEDVFHIIREKDIDIGWGISNNIGFVLAMMIPIAIYKSITSRYCFLYIFLALCEYVGILFTLSRGNILFGGLALSALLIFAIIVTENKKMYILSCVICALIVSCALYAVSGYLAEVIEWLKSIKLDDRGRIELFMEAFEDFKKNILFGVGFFYNYNIIPHWYHNTVLQIIASCGIFGVLGYAVFYFQRYIIPLRHFNLLTFMLLCQVILSELYGLMDCNFFFIYNTLFIVFSSIITERETDTVNIFKIKKLTPQNLRLKKVSL